MKRYLAALLALVLLLTSLAAIASATEEPGMYWDEEGGYYYVKADGTRVKDGWYYIKDGSQTWWDETWVYGESSGFLKEGWIQDAGKWYYLYPELCRESIYDWDTDTVYLFGDDGAWTGVSVKGKTGWVNLNNKWYYIDQYEDGGYKYFYVNTFAEIKDVNYFFKNGVMQDSGLGSYTWKRSWGEYTGCYFANADGSLATGWKQVGGKWYYFDEGGWGYADGLYYINDKHYSFDKKGALEQNMWHKETWTWEDGYKEDHWLYMGDDGAKTGWFKVGKDWYYADEWGWVQNDIWLEYGNEWYYIDEKYVLATGWKEYGGDWFYFKASGAMTEKEWLLYNDNWYYLGEGGAMYYGGTYVIDGKEYKFDDDGKYVP